MKFKILLYLFLFVCLALFYQIFNTNKILNHQDALIQNEYQNNKKLKESLKNIESYCIAQTLKMLKKDSPKTKVVVSYADRNEKHKGIIYRASNWLYQGFSIGRGDAFMYRFPNTKKWLTDRAIGDKLGTNSLHGVLKKVPDMEYKVKFRKHRYIYFLCNKKEKKRLIKELKHPLVNYHHHDKDEMIPVVEKKYWELNG